MTLHAKYGVSSGYDATQFNIPFVNGHSSSKSSAVGDFDSMERNSQIVLSVRVVNQERTLVISHCPQC